MARNYENEAVEKFLLPSQPDEGNFTLRTAYKTALKAYRHDHTHVMEAREQWKQSEQIKDTCWEAEAARVQETSSPQGGGGGGWYVRRVLQVM